MGCTGVLFTIFNGYNSELSVELKNASDQVYAPTNNPTVPPGQTSPNHCSGARSVQDQWIDVRLTDNKAFYTEWQRVHVSESSTTDVIPLSFSPPVHVSNNTSYDAVMTFPLHNHADVLIEPHRTASPLSLPKGTPYKFLLRLGNKTKALPTYTYDGTSYHILVNPPPLQKIGDTIGPASLPIAIGIGITSFIILILLALFVM
jgi:hypothetical protein